MEHESFENADVAEVLNAHFVSIKVDREERPDVDRVYMTFVQATTGSGGWPMSVWLTPRCSRSTAAPTFRRRPVGQAGLRRRPAGDCARLAARSATRSSSRRRRSSSGCAVSGQSEGARACGRVPATDALDRAVAEFAAAFDRAARRLRRRAEVSAAERAAVPAARARAHRGSEPRDMVLHTLRAMALGGMRDHIGGGFHRYSVDGDWRVPHFEKMLYDQAQLVLAYLEAAQVDRRPVRTPRSPTTRCDYVAPRHDRPGRRLLFGRGCRQRAARSRPAIAARRTRWKARSTSGRERRDSGRCSATTPTPFCQRFGVRRTATRRSIRRTSSRNKNLLYTARSIDDVASDTPDQPSRRSRPRWQRSRGRCSSARATRPRPHLDDKVLTAWNGLMIAAFRARPHRVLGRSWRYLVADAARAAAFIRDAPVERRHADAAAPLSRGRRRRRRAMPKTTPI